MFAGYQNRDLIRRIASDILRMAGAAGLAQVLAFGAAPLLTRLYSPQAFGHLAVFSSLMTILSPLISLRYDWALPLPSKDSDALDLLSLCVVAALGSSLASALLAPLVWSIVIKWVDIGHSEIVLLPLGICVLGMHSVVTGWLVRKQAFSRVAHIRFTTTVGAVICQVGFAWVYSGPMSLILGFVGGYLLGLILGIYQCRGALLESAACVRFCRIRRMAFEYRLFSVVTAPSGVINALGSQLPTMVLPSLYGLSLTGQYSLAQRTLSQPVTFVGQAVYQVFWGTSARLFTEEPAYLWPLFLRLNGFLLAVMAPALVLTWLGPAIFEIVFGPAWVQAGRFAGIMVVAAFFGLPAQYTATLEIYRLNHWMAAWEVTRLLLMLVALGTAWKMVLPPVACILGITAVFAISNVVLFGLNAVALWRVKVAAEHPKAGYGSGPPFACHLEKKAPKLRRS